MSRLSGREQAVWDKRNAGLTFKQIAKDLGLCPATVSFAYRKAYRKIEYGKAMKISKLTEKDNFEEHLGDGMHCDYVKFPDGKCAIYNKLAEYENTGLEPKEIEQLKSEQNKVAVEKLEEVINYLDDCPEFWSGEVWNFDVDIFVDKINDLIKELKGEK